MSTAVTRAATLNEFLLSEFAGTLVADAEGPRDWRTSKCFAIWQEEMGFNLLRPVSNEQLTNSISRFYAARGFETRINATRHGGMIRKPKFARVFAITITDNRVLISVCP